MLAPSRETDAPASARIPPSRVLLVAAFGAFLAFLDATIVNVAFPSMRESFADTSVAGLSWVLNAYNIVFAASLILCGRLTDVIGRRRSYLAGVAVFTVASVLCGLAPTVELLVAFRVLQGFGAALLVPASLALVIAAFPADRRAHAIGLWGAAAAVAAGLGPPLGGALVELGDWRWTFLVNLPLGLVALSAARKQLVESRAPGARKVPDLVGAGLLVGALALLNLGIVKGNDWGWSDLATIGSFAVAAALLALFVLSSRRHRVPMLDPTLLRLPSFAIGSLATAVAGFGFYAYLLTNILWLQYVWGYSVLEAGLATAPAALIAAVVAARLGPLAQRLPYRWFIVPGALLWASAYLWYHQQVGLTPDFLGAWMPGQVLSGLGVGATLPLLGSAALSAVPGGRYATASAVVSAARQLGGVLGIAVLVVILGEPTPATVVGSLRDGWLLSIAAFAVVAVVAALLGRSETSLSDEGSTDSSAPARILAPAAMPRPRSSGTPDVRSLSATALFGALPPAALDRLEDASRVVEVPAGAALMEAGDPAGPAYVVRTGRLEVEVAGVRVREVGPGDVLGEIALITGEPRSATIRAVRDSSLLEVPREAFTDVLRTDPSAALRTLEQVAERLRTLRSAPEPAVPATVTVVAVVAAGPGVPVDEAAEMLTARMAQSLRVVVPGRVDPEGLVRAEQDADRVVLVAQHGGDPASEAWRSFCLRQADAVVLVGRSDELPAAPTPRPARQPELVLVGEPPSPEDRRAWAAAVDAWQVTLVGATDLRAGLHDLGDRLAGTSLGVVIAGGGARSLAGIGVIRELEDAGLRVSRLSGSSMGGILAAHYALGLDAAALEEAAYAALVVGRPFNDYALSATSLVRGDRVRTVLTRTLGADTVFEGLPRQLGVVSTDLVSRTRQVHRRGSLVDAVVETCRLPILFPPVPKDDGRLLVDGGVIDNMPTDLLVERDEGPVVAVAIGAAGERTGTRQGRPRVPAMPDTLMRTLMMQSGGVVQTALDLGAWVVAPSGVGVGLLEFHQIDRVVESGRHAARDLLERTGGDFRRPPVDTEASLAPVR